MKQNGLINSDAPCELLPSLPPHLNFHDSIHHLLSRWEGLLKGYLNNCKKGLLLFLEYDTDVLVTQSLTLQARLRELLIAALVDKPFIKDKKEFIGITQDCWCSSSKTFISWGMLKTEQGRSLVESLSNHLLDTLLFMETVFTNYFDYSQTMPSGLLETRRGAMSKKLLEQKIFFAVDNTVDKRVASVFFTFFEKLMAPADSDITYETFIYHSTLAADFLSKKDRLSTQCIREILYYYNYNEEHFFLYECERLGEL